MFVRIDNFGGLVLTKDEKKGPFWTALKAENCDIQSGSIDVAYSLDPASASALTSAAPVKTLYHLDAATFLEWPDDIDIARSPLADNSSKRIYFTGEECPKVTDFSLAKAGAAPYPARSYVLGIPVQPKIPMISAAGGSGVAEDRAYIYTYVSAWGEEGPPSEPVEVTANSVTSTTTIRHIGATSRRLSAGPLGLTCTVAYFAGTPGVLRFTISIPGYNNDVRVGDRLSFDRGSGTNTGIQQGHLVSAVNNAGNGTFDVAANMWGASNVGEAMVLLPVNRFNVIGAVYTAATQRITFSVQITEGLRVGEKVKFSGVGGMVQVNGNTYAVVEIGDDPENPTFDIAWTVAAPGAYTVGGIAERTAMHNTGEVRITGVVFAAGVATVTCDSTAHMEDSTKGLVLIIGVLGARELNGLRKATVLNATQFTVALAAMGAYTGGGVAILNDPYPFAPKPVTAVASAGGAAPFSITVTLGRDHDFQVGQVALGYDIGGAVEANNLMVVSAVATTTVSFSTAEKPVGAYTAGGFVVRVELQARKRLYRTATGTTGAEYQFVDEIHGGAQRYIDTKNGAGLGDVIETDEWIQPPVDMTSIIAHPHGFLMGLSGNVICASEPFQPHAWPIAFQRALPADGVGMGMYGTTAVALTEEIPFNLTGFTPDQMARGRQDVGEPCTAKRSIISTALGVAYRGTSGFFLLGFEGSENATENYLKAATFLNNADTVGAFWGNKLIWIDAGTTTGYIFDPSRADKGLTQFRVDFPVYELHVSPTDAQLWATYTDGGVQKRAPLFKIVAAPAKFTYWTQYVQLPKPVSIGALQVDWDWASQGASMKNREKTRIANVRLRAAGFAAVNDQAIDTVAINGDGFQALYTPNTALTVPTERFCKVTLVANPDSADDLAITFDDFVVDDQPYRVADGIKSDVWQVRIEGNAKVGAVTIAESIEELVES